MSVETLSNEDLGNRLQELTDKAQEIVSGAGAEPSAEQVKAVQEQMTTLQDQVGPLVEEQKRRLANDEMKSLVGRVDTLQNVVKELHEQARSAPELPELGGKADSGAYMDGERSLFKDIMLAAKGNKAGMEAAERLESQIGAKAMTEGTDSAGGYLVRPQYLGELFPRTRLDTLYNIIPKVRVNTDKVEFVSVTEGLAAGWTAELAAKPLGADLSFGTLEASIFTAAGLAVASNQLLEDSSIDRLIVAQLEKRVQEVISAGIVTGTGTGQPRGILNTPGIQDEEYDDASPTVLELLAAIARSLAKVEENHLSQPTHIVLSPSTWTSIITSADAQGKYTLGAGQNDPGQRTAADPLFINRTLFGTPVLLSPSIPRNLDDAGASGGTQTRVIVGDFSESLLLIRNELSVDKSEHVYFTSNQTVFRGERRVGFTAARYPQALCTVSGTGLTVVSSGGIA